MREIQRAIAALCLLLGLWTGPALGQPNCGQRGPMVERLQRTFGEILTADAVTATGALMEIFTSSSGSWTVLVTLPGGPTCLVSAGEAWQPRTPAGTDT